MFVNPTLCVLLNTKTNRYHPIVFREVPLPGDPNSEVLVRSKSYGHHTNGYSTREEAVSDCITTAEQESCRLCLKSNFIWNGEGIPSMIVYFDTLGDELVPLIF